jgi:bifunctional non-homologous end joining protein LigD
MLATLGALPPADEDAQFGYEMKWDGVRAVVYVDSGQVRVLSRNDREITASFPELHGLGDRLRAHRVILDGEIVAFAPSTGQISFAALQSRLHVRKAAHVQRLAEQVPVAYYAFDLLYRDGRVTFRLPYRERRRLLESLELRGTHWDTPPYAAGGGPEALAESRRRRLEGVLAKRLASIYQPGRRSKHWIKVKHELVQEAVIGGWRPGKGQRAETIGSLLLGIPGPRGLDYVGKVGTGFTREMLDDLLATLRALQRKTSPFADNPPARDAKGAHWVTPELVGEVAFPNGPARAGWDIPPGAACAPTNHPPRSSASPDATGPAQTEGPSRGLREPSLPFVPFPGRRRIGHGGVQGFGSG